MKQQFELLLLVIVVIVFLAYGLAPRKRSDNRYYLFVIWDDGEVTDYGPFESLQIVKGIEANVYRQNRYSLDIRQTKIKYIKHEKVNYWKIKIQKEYSNNKIQTRV